MTREFRVAVLSLGALAVAAAGIATARIRAGLAESARQAAYAAAGRGGTEREVLVSYTCAGGARQATFTTNTPPTAEQVAAKVPPGCKVAGIHVTRVRYPFNSDLAREDARVFLEHAKARLAGFTAKDDPDRAAVTVTVLAERRVLFLTLRGEASATRGVDEAAVAAEADGKLFAAADALVAERDKALNGQKTVPERTVKETGPKPGDPLPPDQQKTARAKPSGRPPTAGEIFDFKKLEEAFGGGGVTDPNFHPPLAD